MTLLHFKFVIRYFALSSTCLLTTFLLIANPLSIYAVSQSLKVFAKPLTLDQIIEIEKNPRPIVAKCVSTLQNSISRSDNLESFEKGRLELCDSIVSYLQNKCNEFKNLLEYCEQNLPALGVDTNLEVYYDQRTLQFNCLQNLSYVGPCKEYFSNSSRLTLKFPISVSIKEIGLNNNTGEMEMAFSINNPNPLDTKLVNLSYKVLKQGNMFFSGSVEGDLPANSSKVIKTKLGIIYPTLRSVIRSDTPFEIDGIYRYENFSSGIVNKSFNLFFQ